MSQCKTLGKKSVCVLECRSRWGRLDTAWRGARFVRSCSFPSELIRTQRTAEYPVDRCMTWIDARSQNGSGTTRARGGDAETPLGDGLGVLVERRYGGCLFDGSCDTESDSSRLCF